MEFRIKAIPQTLVCAFLAAGIAVATPLAQTRAHLRHGSYGELRVNEQGIAFGQEYCWNYEQIQRLELSQDSLRLLTYEDTKLGRDRVYVFDQLPEGFAKSAYRLWRDRLDQRFVAAIADPDVPTVSEFPARLTGLFRGVEGKLVFGEDRIVFRAVRAGESRTWRLSDIRNIASAGRFDLSIVTLEREFRFQLQRPLEEARFNELWRRVLRAGGTE